jgi:SulP family sulfate permease
VSDKLRGASHKRRASLLPDWVAGYDRPALAHDAIAAIIVTVMLIPQALAYATIAGLPPEAGLYASILPPIAYALFGSSRTMAVGPVAVVSLMTASTVGQVAASGTVAYLDAAVTLALLSGGMLLLMALLRLGALSNLLSNTVVAGFVASSGILIAASQLATLLGIEMSGSTLPDMAMSLAANVSGTNAVTLALGAGTLGVLILTRTHLRRSLVRSGISARVADLATRAAPMLVVIAVTLLTGWLNLKAHGVSVVGDIPQGLPPLRLPQVTLELVGQLLVPALFISLIGFAESLSVGQTLAARRQERIHPNRELVGLGVANLAAGISSGYPIAGGFARSVVNHDAGARTPIAGVLTAVGVAAAALFLGPLLADLPHAVLAAIIIVAVLSLVDLGIIRRTLAYSRVDAVPLLITIAVTLVFGVEPGLLAGISSSLLTHFYRTSRPHIAIVGQVPGTEHFRNRDRHQVVIDPHILSIRIDESLHFANCRGLEDRVAALVAASPGVRHVILMCSAVNAIDASGLSSLLTINERLKAGGMAFHLSEVKGPVHDHLLRSELPMVLTGRIHFTQYEAVRLLRDDGTETAG